MANPSIKRSTRRVVSAWKRGRKRSTSDAIWTDGTVIYSFGVIIAAKSHEGEAVISRPAPTFGRVTRQRIAEVMELVPNHTIAGVAL